MSSIRPIYREPSAARLGQAVAGGVAAGLWMLLFGLLAQSARAYAWWTVAGGLLAFGAAAALAWRGDRGVAAGVAIGAGLGVAIGFVVVLLHWIHGGWLLW